MKDFILLLLLFYIFYFIKKKKKIDYFKIMRDEEKEGEKKKEKPNPAFPLLGRKEMILLFLNKQYVCMYTCIGGCGGFIFNSVYVCKYDMYIWMDE